MEQHKLETQFREKLNSREIKPTEMAWNRLDAMLTVVEKNKPKRKLNWLYMAASFIGLLLAGTVFFNQNENIIPSQKNTVLKDSVKTILKQNNVVKKDANLSQTKPNFERKSLVQVQKNTNSKIDNLQFNTPTNKVVENKTNQNATEIIQNTNVVSENKEEVKVVIENEKLASVHKTKISINPNLLLDQVDQELQVSFREKALNTITKKYKEAREALANRNNQSSIINQKSNN